MSETPVDGRLARAQALVELGRTAEAVPLISEALAAEPEHAGAWRLLAVTQIEAGDAAGALHSTHQALSQDGENASSWQIRALAEARAGNLPAAEWAAGQAVRLAPQNHRNHLILARVLAGAPGRLEDALAAARVAVELAPAEADPHLVTGQIAYSLRRREEAESCFRRALEIDPANAEARNAIGALWTGRFRSRRRRFGDALDAFAGAAASDADDPNSRFNLQVMLWNLAAKSRWIGLLGLFVGLIGAASSGAGQGRTPAPGALVPRLVAAALILTVVGLWLLRVRHRVPGHLHSMLVRVARHSSPVAWMAIGAALPAVAGLALVLVPWSEPTMLPLAIFPSVFGMILCYWTSRTALVNHRPRG
ncbi:MULTISPECIES: tetratricopeptide repeat protein [unclassified Streptomyces]|uniref:tetratricopeptide repeat protein n=1 Tax=unclassified Streptomyces TaxID=2593676 RepID=UPI0015E167DC|nr:MULTISPECIES: tetratricopeptide repeat protein [unclassified Streptomyces]